MKTFHFNSCLAKHMECFVALRRLSGTDYQSQTMLLEYFDRFLVADNFKIPYLTPDIIHRYLAGISHLHVRSQYNRFSVVRQLCCYLSQFEPRCYLPEPIKSMKSSSSRIPYIFTKPEIRSLLARAAGLLPQHSLRPHTYYTLFGLLYTTGLRIGEALALDVKDVYLDSSRLHIREGKFHKSRWVPLASSTCSVLEKYLNRRHHCSPLGPDSPLFISLRSSRLHHCTVYQTFRILLKNCGIRDYKGPGPRIHDLRHTFAVHRLLAWYRDGMDINARLPALATYMGHVGVGSTQVYIQAIPELFEEAHQRSLTYFHQNFITRGGMS
jgi:site-specific recombinase XerD